MRSMVYALMEHLVYLPSNGTSTVFISEHATHFVRTRHIYLPISYNNLLLKKNKDAGLGFISI